MTRLLTAKSHISSAPYQGGFFHAQAQSTPPPAGFFIAHCKVSQFIFCNGNIFLSHVILFVKNSWLSYYIYNTLYLPVRERPAKSNPRVKSSTKGQPEPALPERQGGAETRGQLRPDTGAVSDQERGSKRAGGLIRCSVWFMVARACGEFPGYPDCLAVAHRVFTGWYGWSWARPR